MLRLSDALKVIFASFFQYKRTALRKIQKIIQERFQESTNATKNNTDK